MRKQLFLVFLTIFSIESYSQIVFEKGYFIDESDQKIKCLIKNIDWRNNPTRFEYKLALDAETQVADILNVKEFGIDSLYKYVRATVKIDKSGVSLNDIGIEKNPVYQEERLFLKVLIEGKASLFTYINKDLTRFFFEIQDSGIRQLVYKQYWDDGSIAENIFFRQQLFTNLKCNAITQKDVENIKYSKRDLERLFINYNKCTNSDYIKFLPEQQKDLFNLTIRPGINYSSIEIENSVKNDAREIDFGNEISFRFGTEAEFILPFNKNKWGVIIEPTFQYYKSENTEESMNLTGGVLVRKINYQSIDIPLGIRHYHFFNDDSKIFANISYIFSFSNNSVIDFSRSDGSSVSSLKINSRRNIGLGVGYKFLDRYSMEIRYQTNKDILAKYANWSSGYRTLCLVWGYSIF